MQFVAAALASCLAVTAPSVADPFAPEPSAPTSAFVAPPTSVWSPVVSPSAATDRGSRHWVRSSPDWRARDRRLVIATGITGATWIASSIAAIALGIEVRKGSDCANGPACEHAADRAARLAAPTYAMAGIAGAALIGFVVSAALLGVHRSQRPQFAGLGTRRIALARSGLGLRF